MPGGIAFLQEDAGRIERYRRPGATQQCRDRLTQCLAVRIPECQLHSAQRVGGDPLVTKPPTRPATELVHEPVRMVQVFTYQKWGDRVGDESLHNRGIGAPKAVARLAPAHEAIVGLDSDEAVGQRLAVVPKGERESLDFGDSHLVSGIGSGARRLPGHNSPTYVLTHQTTLHGQLNTDPWNHELSGAPACR